MAGDTVDISAKAFYNIDNAAPGRGISIAPIVGNILAGLTNPAGATLGEASRAASSLGTSTGRTLNLAPLADGGRDEKTVQPKSGINFVLYSNTFDVVKENTGYLPVNDNINRIQTLASDRLIMKEAGFLDVFVNNEANTPVYYDNMMVTHNSGSSANVIEVNAYYPFGMIIPSLSKVAPPEKYNAYKFGAKELQRELELNWYDFGARMYQPSIARWWAPDPAAELYYSTSPYAYVRNNPINAIDPNGLWEELPNDYFDKFTGAYLGSDRDMRNDNVYLIESSTWEAKRGEEWTSRVEGSISLEETKGINGFGIDKNKIFKEIGNHYYQETGYGLNELENSSITLFDKWDSFAEIDYRNNLFQLNITPAYIGSTISNRYDFINLMVHERGYHGTRFLKGEKWDPRNNIGQEQLWESEAFSGQMNHPSWLQTSPGFRAHILRESKKYLKWGK
jgi:RHS repeat-associated protein